MTVQTIQVTSMELVNLQTEEQIDITVSHIKIIPDTRPTRGHLNQGQCSPIVRTANTTKGRRT